jgi:hypothetical protein
LVEASAECKLLLAECAKGDPSRASYSEILENSRWRACLEEFRCARFPKALEHISRIESFGGGVLVVAEAGLRPEFETGSLDTKLFALWANFLGARPREMGFML